MAQFFLRQCVKGDAMATDKSKANGLKESVWEKNDIPPLEYCSLNRATRLLGCEIDDLWHWQNIGAIRFAIDIGTDVPMNGAIFPPESDENTIKLESVIDMVKLISDAVVYHGLYKKGFEFTLTGDPAISNGQINFEGLCGGVFNFELTINRNNPERWGSKNFVRIEENEYADLFIRVGELSDLDGQEDKLFITRAYIEEIHNAKENGFYLSSKGYVGRRSLPTVRITSYQSEMIASLLRIVGFSDDEIHNLPAEQINTKLGQMAAVKGVRIAQPDKNTWAKWRERFTR